MNVCVFAASSSRIDGVYAKDASELGSLLADAGMNILYGGGGIGLMGNLADAALKKGGSVTGVIPSFMMAEGWGHKLVSDMVVTADMGERKKWLFDRADAVVALPGGIGTLEELTEAITLKQLGIYKGPIIILNTSGFYKKFIDFMDQLIAGNFLRLEHKDIWEIVNKPNEVIKALSGYKGWLEDPRRIARIC
jgi:uncharacterized protein (TIGR00730 family)